MLEIIYLLHTIALVFFKKKYENQYDFVLLKIISNSIKLESYKYYNKRHTIHVFIQLSYGHNVYGITSNINLMLKKKKKKLFIQ